MRIENYTCASKKDTALGVESFKGFRGLGFIPWGLRRLRLLGIPHQGVRSREQPRCKVLSGTGRG